MSTTNDDRLPAAPPVRPRRSRARAAAAPPAGGTAYRYFAMDTAFHHSLGAYRFDARCEMLRELGFDATYLTLWSENAWHDLARLPQVRRRYGLDVAAVYATLDITQPLERGENARVLQLVRTLDGCARIELTLVPRRPARAAGPGSAPAPAGSVAPSDPAGDARALPLLEALLEAAAQRGITLALYPHANHWLETIGDAVRLCRALPHPHLGAVFCGYHWYAADGAALPDAIANVAPYLRSANLCGSRRLRDGSATLEPLDDGELDNFVVLALLRAAGYRGDVGIQGYAVGGDVYAKLRRSLAALRDMEARVEAHPEWALLRQR